MADKESKYARLFQTFDQLSQDVKLLSANAKLVIAAQYALSQNGYNRDQFLEMDALLKKNTGWLSTLSREIRYCLSAFLIQKNVEPAAIPDIMQIYRKLIKTGFVRQQQSYFAATVLLKNDQQESVIEKAFHLYKLLKKKHPILTNQNDVSLVALLAQKAEEAETIFEQEEQIYGVLQGEAFKRNDDLQALACLLTVLHEEEGAQRAEVCGQLKRAVEDSRIKLHSCCYPTLGILSVVSDSPQTIQAILYDYRKLRDQKVSLFISNDLYFQTAVAIYVSTELENQNFSVGVNPALMTSQFISMQEALQAAAMTAATSVVIASSSGNSN